VTFALAFDDVEAAFGVELIFNFSDPLPIILMVILHTSFDVWHVDDEMIVKHVPLTVDMGVDRHLVVGRNTFCQFDPDVMASLPVVGIGGVKIFNPKRLNDAHCLSAIILAVYFTSGAHLTFNVVNVNHVNVVLMERNLIW